MFNKKQKNKFLLVSLLCILSSQLISSNNLNAESLYFSSCEIDIVEPYLDSKLSKSFSKLEKYKLSAFKSFEEMNWQESTHSKETNKNFQQSVLHMLDISRFRSRYYFKVS